MAVITIKSTYSLDVESVRVLEALAQRWNVSKSEVLRRAIRIAATGGEPGESAPLGTLDRLQASLRERQMEWAAEIVGQRLDFTAEHAALAARLFNESGRRRGSLIDCMIAATALAAAASLATANDADFLRFKDSGLTMA